MEEQDNKEIKSNEESSSASEVFSYVVQKAIGSLFEGDFKKKIEEL